MKIFERKTTLILCHVLFLCLLLFSCGKESPDPTAKIAERYLRMSENMLKPDPEKAALLSMKYNIEANKVYILLEKYFPSDQRLDFDKIFEEFEKSRTELVTENIKKITETSNEFELPKEVLASLIIDYIVWTKCEEASTSY
ncbi:MAG: hypothetical protein WBC70_07625 [Candidatus Aminicenantales bacterium]